MDTTPKVFSVIPVHNRIQITKRCVEYLQAQDYPALRIIIIDDGSTDGTGDYLRGNDLPNLETITGNGNLWWGGAMNLGIKRVTQIADELDYLLMLNDDVHFSSSYVSTLVQESVSYNHAVVGSSQRDEKSGSPLGCGYLLDHWAVKAVGVIVGTEDRWVDALSGRGTLFPVQAVRNAGQINDAAFPHYLGDLEYSSRVKRMGYPLVASAKATIYTSAQSSDSSIRDQGLVKRYWSARSKDNLWHRLRFFSGTGPRWLRWWTMPRLIVAGGFRLTRKMY